MAKKVLLAEDYADTRQMMRFMLESFGYEVVEARDGYEALLAAEKDCPDLVLMDIAMPIMNGITSATLIRALDNCRDIPIVAVTAFCDQYVESSSDFGFDYVMEKPVDIDELRKVVDEHMSAATEV
ncbi:MAG: response regulator [Pyrinomonadaceae bacterium]